MSSMRSGISTLNRWLGKKNKDGNAATTKTKLSQSNTNLSISSTNISDTSHYQQQQQQHNDPSNKSLTVAPIETIYEPYEHTLRITVLLPKDQLFVARLGARVSLLKLLQQVCDSKLLDEEKFEFRHPVDPSQVFDLNLTIGSVGLAELRLCRKSETYLSGNYNNDEITKLQRASVVRDSLSSSEFSSQNSKHTTTKTTASPYSSTNSLNSMDSAGINNYAPRAQLSLPPVAGGNGGTTPTTKVVMAPPRKKRTAPRPPSQLVIPEQTALVIEPSAVAAGGADANHKQQLIRPVNNNSNLPNKNLLTCVSTPNLTSSNVIVSGDIDCNGNMKVIKQPPSSSASMDETAAPRTNSNRNNNRDDDHDDVDNVEAQKNARNVVSSSVSLQSLNSIPEPLPRKRVFQVRKKLMPAPPPPPSPATPATLKSSLSQTFDDDNGATFTPIATTPVTTSSTVLLQTPIDSHIQDKEKTAIDRIVSVANADKPMPNVIVATDAVQLKPLQREAVVAKPIEQPAPMSQPRNINIPKPVPRLTTTTLLNASSNSGDFLCVSSTSSSSIAGNSHSTSHSSSANISKVLLNRTPTPEPRSLSCEPPEMDSNLVAQVSAYNNALHSKDEDNASKQADSGIGEPVPSPVPDSLPSEGSMHESKTFESSSDDDEIVKVYNFKLGKTSKKQTQDDAPPQEQHKSSKHIQPATSSPSSSSAYQTDTALAAAAALAIAEIDNAVAEEEAEDEDVEHVDDTESCETTSACSTLDPTPTISDSTSWNFAIPISPPPNFADNKQKATSIMVTTAAATDASSTAGIDSKPDSPITPKIQARPVLNFDNLATDETVGHQQNDFAFKMPQQPSKYEAAAVRSNNSSSTSTLQSPTTPLNELYDELNTVFHERRVDSLIKKPSSKPIEIQSAKPNTLANFSICTIASQTQKPNGIYVCDDSHSSSAYEGDSNNGKQRKPIARADSFHAATRATTTATNKTSTNAETINGGGGSGLGARSASTLSINDGSAALELAPAAAAVGVGLNGKRSLSELSIGESPSLQSLEVMKTILNTRKNSLTNVNGELPAEVNTKQSANVAETHITSVVFKPKISKDSTGTVEKELPTIENNCMEQETAELKVVKQKQELPKVYRYSGPPSINFATWSERPKALVAIKNEGDYIFGVGKNNANSSNMTIEQHAKSMPRNYRASLSAATAMPAPTTTVGIKQRNSSISAAADDENVPPLTTTTDSTIKRMGIPEQEQFCVPVTVRPLKDVADEYGVTKTSNNLLLAALKQPNGQQKATVETKRPISQVYTANVGAMSSPSANSNNLKRFSTPAATQVQPTLESTANANAALEQLASAPFGQNTLRKTGLKEKILLESQQNNTTTTTETIAPKIPPKATAKPAGPVITTINKRKFVQLEKSGGGIGSVGAPTYHYDGLPKSNVLAATQQNAKAPQSPAMPQPPPPPPSNRPAVKATVSASRVGSNSPNGADTRNQLLEAIRNFKRHDLSPTAEDRSAT